MPKQGVHEIKPLCCQSLRSLCIWPLFVLLANWLKKNERAPWITWRCKHFCMYNLPSRFICSSFTLYFMLNKRWFFSPHSLPSRQIGGCFCTVVKYQKYFMDKCSIFPMILHTFCCGSYVLKHLAVDAAGYTSGFVLYANRKIENEKKLDIYCSKMLDFFLFWFFLVFFLRIHVGQWYQSHFCLSLWPGCCLKIP